MKIHEYQAKEILRKYGVATPRGIPCFTVDEAIARAEARRQGVVVKRRSMPAAAARAVASRLRNHRMK